ncbi:MAG: SdrD B-like domain-containing protein, partial [Thermoanaerobaculia bacterium]
MKRQVLRPPRRTPGRRIAALLAAFLVPMALATVLPAATVGDFVWEDDDGDGVQDIGETGLSGILVELRKDSDDSLVDSDTTTAAGAYSITGIAADTYYLEFEAPAGFIFSPQGQGGDISLDSDPDPADGRTASFTLTAAQTRSDLDAGLFRLATVGDFVWEDDDGDGIQDAGESGLAGVVVNLLTPTFVLVDSDTTTATGAYLIADIAPGDYVVEFEAPTDFLFSPQGAGGDTALDSDPDPADGRTSSFTLVSGDAPDDVDAGLFKLATVAGRVWFDADADAQDVGEGGYSGLTVALYDASLTLIDTATTGPDGTFELTDLALGDYVLELTTIPDGFALTEKDQGDDATDSDFDTSTARTDTVTLRSGDLADRDAGLIRAAGAIGDRVWHDDNGDGLQGMGEGGVPAVEVRLLASATEEVLKETFTDADGRYEFSGVPVGDYVLELVTAGGVSFSPKDEPPDDNLDSDFALFVPVPQVPGQVLGRTDSFSVAAGDRIENIDGGLIFVAAELSGSAWRDDNGDGIQDAGELPFAALEVGLLTSQPRPLAVTATGIDGTYFIGNLTPDSYSLQLDPPAGFALSPS